MVYDVLTSTVNRAIPEIKTLYKHKNIFKSFVGNFFLITTKFMEYLLHLSIPNLLSVVLEICVNGLSDIKFMLAKQIARWDIYRYLATSRCALHLIIPAIF